MNSEFWLSVKSAHVCSDTVCQTFRRLNWLDWMKAIGITLVVYGHFFSLCHTYVYVFHVPMFFILSGFLSRVEDDNRLFWMKLWHNLILPLLIISTANYCIRSVKGYYTPAEQTLPENPLLFIAKMIFGMHTAVREFWFVYTLAVLKIILQYARGKFIHIALFVLFLAFAYCIKNFDIEVMGIHPFDSPCSIVSTFVSYPFFIIGYYSGKMKSLFTGYKAGASAVIWTIIAFATLVLCGYNHGFVGLLLCDYGDGILLFLLGGMAGTAVVFFISKALELLHMRMITDISAGTSVILGFHIHLVSLFRTFFSSPSVWDVFFSILIVLLFVPVIRMCKAYFPVVMGKYRAKAMS